MAVFKTVYTVTVLGEFDNEQQAEQAFAEAELLDVAYHISEGDWIGQYSGANDIKEVPADQVEVELLNIGNDGSFFNNEVE